MVATSHISRSTSITEASSQRLQSHGADSAPLEIIRDALKIISPSWSETPTFEFTGDRVKIRLDPNRKITGEEVQAFADQIHGAARSIRFQLIFPAGKRPVSAASPSLSARSPLAPRFQKGDLAAEIVSSFPKEADLLRPYFYELGLGRQKARIVILRVHVPSKSVEQKLQSWKDDVQQKYGALVLIARARHSSGIKAIVNEIGGAKQRMLTSRDERKVSQAIQRIFGPQPTAPPSPSKLITRTPSLAGYRFQAWDLPHVKDREDAFSAKLLPSGNYRLLVAFIDVSHFVTPGSSYDKHAERVGASIYSRYGVVSTIGTKTSEGLASFQLNQTRDAWIVELFVSPEGKILNESSPQILREQIKVEEFVDPSPQYFSIARSLNQDVQLLADVGMLLAKGRNGHAKLRRIDGDGVGHIAVGEIMIAAKGAIGKYMSSLGLPALYRAQEAPSLDVRKRLVDAIQKIGIPGELEDFHDPGRLTSLLAALDSQRGARAKAIIQKIVDVFLLRSYYTEEVREHRSLGKLPYASIKPRESDGIFNQMSLNQVFTHKPYFSSTEIGRRVANKNENNRHRDEVRNRIGMLLMLKKILPRTGETFEARVVSSKGRHLVVSVPGLTKNGMLLSHENDEWVEDQTVTVRFVGFSKDAMRMVFE